MLNITAFLSYVFITTFTPGPNNIMAMSNGTRYGFKPSLKFNFGVFAGFFIMILLCSVFSYGLYTVIPSIKPVMTIIGATYILWLAWKIFNSSPSSINNETKSTNRFQTGLLMQFVNPKAILYGLTTTSTFIIPYYNSPWTISAFAFFLAFLSLISTSCWSAFGSLFQIFFTQHNKTVKSVMSLLLVYCAVSLFF